MDIESPFEGPPEDTREELLRAAFLVLQQHGYSGLSMNRIANEAGLQKASVYYHYSDKDSLLLALVDYVIEELKYRTVQPDGTEPLQQLQRFIDQVVFGQETSTEPPTLSPPSEATIQVFIQIRAQAAHTQAYQEKVTQIDQIHQNHIADIIQRGIDEGAFHDVDADQIAAMLTTLATGVLLRRVTTTIDLEPVRKATHAYLREALLPDGSDHH
jgi:AcrR family transcriptional regulator